MKTLMIASLAMSAAYHTPVAYWLSLPLFEFMQWAAAAKQMNEEESKQK
jgi:hypothetical protein